MSRPSLPASDRTEPTPYELYIRLSQLTASWPDGRDGWAGEIVAACGFQAAELTLRLIDDALRDDRPAASPQRRVARYADHLIDGVELTCRLLRKLPPPASAAGPGTGDLRRPPLSPGFAVLSRLDRDELDRISGRLTLATAGLHFEVGIEEQVRDARREHGLVNLVSGDPGVDAPVMDYHAVVSPDRVYGLRERTPCGPEDHLFATVHQITECWLNIVHHYLAEALVLAQRGRWAAAADAMANATDVLPLAVQAGQLLDQMVLADYHPLRVRLRDGSGAQSPAARRLGRAIQAAAGALWTALDIDNLSVLDVLQRPNEHADLYRYLCTLKTGGKRIQSFMFHHYLLALGVLGTHSLGSMGYETRKMAERACQPMFPEINEAHHDYVMLTNFEHGDSSGSIVYDNELAHGWNPYPILERPSGCPREVVQARVAAYFRAIEERDAEAWVNLFDRASGQLHDVPGTRPYFGHNRLRVFVNGMFNAFSEMRGVYSPPRIDGNTATVEWQFDARSYRGVPTTFNGREEFVFDDDGRILKAVAYWDPAVVAQQWRQGAHKGATEVSAA